MFLASFPYFHLWKFLPPIILFQHSNFPSKMILHEEKANSFTENLPNFTTPLVSNTEEGNGTFTFKETTSQPDRLEFVDTMRK